MDVSSVRENSKSVLTIYIAALTAHVLLTYHYNPDSYCLGAALVILSVNVAACVIIRHAVLSEFDRIHILILITGVVVIETSFITWIYQPFFMIHVAFILIHNGTGVCVFVVFPIPTEHVRPCLNLNVETSWKPLPDGLLSYVVVPKEIGIFSRAADEEYAWLTDILKSSFKVSPCFIHNNNFSGFLKAASQCQFAILYHSKTRGRVNITDVTDSLYDNELEHLSERLGKRSVVVVADDLDDSSWETKLKILENQPSISRFSQDLFVFTRMDKQSPNLRHTMEPLMKLIRSA